MTRFLKSTLRRFRDNEDGSMVVPFALWTPVFLGLIISAIEMGTVTIRHTLLERAVDVAVRDMRLGLGPNDHAGLKHRICDEADILPGCNAMLHVELITLDMQNWASPPMNADCVDTSSTELTPQRNFSAGGSHDVVMIRACFKFRPLTPMAVFQASLPKDTEGYTAIVSTAAYVNEPS